MSIWLQSTTRRKEAVLEQLLADVRDRNRRAIELRLTADSDPVARLRDYVLVCIGISRTALAPVLPRVRRILANGLPPSLADFPNRVDRDTPSAACCADFVVHALVKEKT